MPEISEKKILVVDDEADNIDLLNRLLGHEGYEVHSATNGAEAVRKAIAAFFQVIVLDLRMPGMDGIQVLEKLKEKSSQSQILILTAYGSDESIKKACGGNAFDFIDKPVDNKLLLHKIQKAFEYAATLFQTEEARKKELEKNPYKDIIGSNARIKDVFKRIDKVGPTDSCVLITGETGTGKELVARACHEKSQRAGNPFKSFNVGALPETLLEAELFGYEKSAYTGAMNRKIGYFESCQGGTIFLDEIGDISLMSQVKILRVLQEKTITRLGSTESIKVNVRVITATNKDLEDLVKKGDFRQDLYFRINTINIHLPPLRERKDDIEPLVNYFIKKYSGKDVKISAAAMNVLLEYNYPGNIRELEHIIEHALIFQENNLILPKDLPPELTGHKLGSAKFAGIFELPWEEAKNDFEKMYIREILQKAQGNITEAAKISGIDRSYFHKQIKKYDIKVKR